MEVERRPEPVSSLDRDLWDIFDEDVYELIDQRSSASHAIQELQKYLEDPLLPRTEDPLKWWMENKSKFPNIYELALKLLSIPATSVPSERLFSKSGRLLEDNRNRLAPKKTNMILFLYSNL